MVVRFLDRDKDPFRSKGDDEDILGPEFPYLGAIVALMYLASCTRPDMALSINLLARYNASPKKSHWVGVKNICSYLQAPKILVYSIRKIKREPWWGIAMLDTCQIP